MKKNQITQNLIESLSESVNDEFVEKTRETVNELASLAISDLSQKNAFIVPQKCIFLPVNEVVTGAFSQSSQYDFFLGIDNPQIATNTKSKRKINWKYLWSEYKANFRIGKRKDKKKKEKKSEKNNEKDAVQLVTKYSLSNFRHDFMMSMSNFLTSTSVLYEHENRITIVGSEDFGSSVKINIYVTLFDSAVGEFRLFNESKNKFISVDFGKRFETLTAKIKSCGKKNVIDMLKIFNALYARSANKVPNQILIESLVVGAPDELFVDGNTFRTFVNLANYVRIKEPRSFASVCEKERSLFDEPLVVKSGAQAQYSRLVHILDEFKF